MICSRWLVPGATGIALCAGIAPAAAHHSFAAVTDVSRPVQATMTLTKVDWINPHTWLQFGLRGADGSVTGVRLENEGIAGLRRAGFMGAEDFPVGELYDVIYYPNRDGSAGGYLAKITNVASGRAYEHAAPQATGL